MNADMLTKDYQNEIEKQKRAIEKQNILKQFKSIKDIIKDFRKNVFEFKVKELNRELYHYSSKTIDHKKAEDFIKEFEALEKLKPKDY